MAYFYDASTNNPTKWNWTFEGGTPATSTDQNPVITYSIPGIYDVTLVISNLMGSDTVINSDFVIIGTAPLSGFTTDLDTSLTTSTGVVSFTNTSTNATSYTWYFGDSTSTVSTASTLSHTYSADGEFKVQMIASNGGCSDTALTTIKVTKLNASTDPIKVSSNIGKGSISVSFNFDASTDLDLKIYNVAGQIVAHYTYSQIKSIQSLIELPQLKQGLYYFNFQYNGEETIKKVIISE